MNKKYIDILLSLVFITLACFLFKSTLEFNESSIVTTGIYIKFLAICLGLAGIFELIRTIYKNENTTFCLTSNPKKFFLLILFLVAFIELMTYAGFFIAAAIFLPVTMRYMGYLNFIRSIIYSACIILFIYGLFVEVFEIPLPECMLFQE